MLAWFGFCLKTIINFTLWLKWEYISAYSVYVFIVYGVRMRIIDPPDQSGAPFSRFESELGSHRAT